ncbi:glycoside hydrolase family 55 protein [Aulographum hederae CBS 113979]|uniref:Glycoside hydrolase family 55 protein n=1 Tax=Aulographum hederae CBS 113979 TaxID=1176131 RepID=A0A6G1HGD3_9PEZI|nr:glycoside hydrolase family 55 protein [Aulographum hederae CBS 113979]
MSQIKRQGVVAYNTNKTYPLWRNVKDYGAIGDGVADDTAAINSAINATGLRCGAECDSSTVYPALVYVPPGTYRISTPIVMFYYTQLVGDAINPPTIKGTADFDGIALLDSDVYYPGQKGRSWYANQNNFYRQVRNFVLDITLLPESIGACVHWQVAQATSLTNLVMNMRIGGRNNKQQGIFMDNGSGGWISDLVFNGGGIAFYLGNQQFTSRNLIFNNCITGIFMNWDWVWAFKTLKFNNCKIGIDMTQGGGYVQAVGSASVQDSVFRNVSVGILTTFSKNSTPVSGGTLVVDNCDFQGAQQAIAFPNGTTIVPGGGVVQSFAQGKVYSAYQSAKTYPNNLTCYVPTANVARIQQVVAPPPKPLGLLTASGTVFEKSKPQWETFSRDAFISVKDNGATGDGVTDDSNAIQTIFDNYVSSGAYAAGKIIYFDHGAYVVTKTINVPRNIRIQGEMWPLIMVRGANSAFGDMENPVPAWRVGQPGEVGNAELVELVFETLGSAPGAIMMEWNLAGETQGSAGMWEVHFRIGGTNGTQLQSDTCVKTPYVNTIPSNNCIGSFMLLHVTKTASLYMENNWGWVSDHELDLKDHQQINIWNGRGILIESRLPTWVYGSSFEHCMLYNYQIANAQNVYMSLIQSETAYMQANPSALMPFPPDARYSDPDFGWCFQRTCYKTWALRVYNSTYVLMYGAGLYSFFDNYDSGCIPQQLCQEHIVSVEISEGIYFYALNTLASINMVTVDRTALVPASQNLDGFTQAVAIFEYP